MTETTVKPADKRSTSNTRAGSNLKGASIKPTTGMSSVAKANAFNADDKPAMSSATIEEPKRTPSASRLAGTARDPKLAEAKKAGDKAVDKAKDTKVPAKTTTLASKTSSLNKSLVPGKPPTTVPDKSAELQKLQETLTAKEEEVSKLF
jgi:hypothetical protein